MEETKRILVVSRMTRDCRVAIHHGVSLAKKYGAELFVIHVVHNPFGRKGWSLPTISLETEYQKILKDAKADLDRIISLEQGTGLSIREVIKEGDPTKEILKTVRDEKIDLMIMLAHEEGRIEHLVFGRSNEELIRKMPCSILLVKK